MAAKRLGVCSFCLQDVQVIKTEIDENPHSDRECYQVLHDPCEHFVVLEHKNGNGTICAGSSKQPAYLR